MVQLKKKVKLKQKTSTQATVKTPYKSLKSVLCWGGLALLIIILCLIFVPKACSTDTSNEKNTLVSDTLSAKDTTTGPVSVTKERTSKKSAAESTTSSMPEMDRKGTSMIADKENKDAQSLSNTSPKPSEETTSTSEKVTEDVKTEALSVIRGNYGNNPDRRRLLKERYHEIQNKVNEMYRNGQVN